MDWRLIEYTRDKAGNITLPDGPPFDGEPVLILLGTGIVEAFWMDWRPTPSLEDPHDGDGWCWVCLDDSAPMAEFDEPSHWMPLPPPPKEEK